MKTETKWNTALLVTILRHVTLTQIPGFPDMFAALSHLSTNIYWLTSKPDNGLDYSKSSLFYVTSGIWELGRIEFVTDLFIKVFINGYLSKFQNYTYSWAYLLIEVDDVFK